MLTRLELENFKSWEKVKLSLAPITAIFGSNSSGKSSLLQFLLLLQQTQRSNDRNIPLDFGNRDSEVDLGSFKHAVFKHENKRSIGWRLDWQQEQKFTISDPESARSSTLFEGTKFGIKSKVSLRNSEPSTDELSYFFDDNKFSLTRKNESTDFKLESKYKFRRVSGRAWELPSPVKSYAFPDQAINYFQNAGFLADLAIAYEKQMGKIYHLGPLRDSPKREYPWGGSSPNDVGVRGERAVEAILAANSRKETRNLKYRSKHVSFEEIIAIWLKKMELIHSFEVKDIGQESQLYRVHVQRDQFSTKTLITDVGFGVSQVLPVIVLLYYVQEGSTVILEQPEIHLHPAVQAALADLLIAVAKNRNVQIIVESHSEHFLHRLMRRLAEQGNSPYPKISVDDLALYFTESRDGKSVLKPLEIDLVGQIHNWPKDFFGDVIGEIFARDKAALKNRISRK